MHTMLVNSDTREAALGYLSAVIERNGKRSQLQVTNMYSSAATIFCTWLESEYRTLWDGSASHSMGTLTVNVSCHQWLATKYHQEVFVSLPHVVITLPIWK